MSSLSNPTLPYIPTANEVHNSGWITSILPSAVPFIPAPTFIPNRSIRRAANIADTSAPTFNSPETFTGVTFVVIEKISSWSTKVFNPFLFVYCTPKLNLDSISTSDDNDPSGSNPILIGISTLIPATGVGILISISFFWHFFGCSLQIFSSSAYSTDKLKFWVRANSYLRFLTLVSNQSKSIFIFKLFSIVVVNDPFNCIFFAIVTGLIFIVTLSLTVIRSLV